MTRWQGFTSQERPPADHRCRIRLNADYGGPDNDPLPLCLIRQANHGRTIADDIVELTAEELEWVVSQAPRILEQMRSRP